MFGVKWYVVDSNRDTLNVVTLEAFREAMWMPILSPHGKTLILKTPPPLSGQVMLWQSDSGIMWQYEGW